MVSEHWLLKLMSMSVFNIRSIADCSDVVSQADEYIPPTDKERAELLCTLRKGKRKKITAKNFKYAKCQRHIRAITPKNALRDQCL